MTTIHEASTDAHNSASSVTVKIVDSDVHPTPKAGALVEYIATQHHSAVLPRGREIREEAHYYDVPDFSESMAMRADAYPPDGGFPCSDPDFAELQLMRAAGVDIGILEPLTGSVRLPESDCILKSAINEWLASEWISRPHGRWRGAISVADRLPANGAKEIDKWGDHPGFVQVLMTPQTSMGFGDPFFDPIYEAACRHGLPMATHLMGLGPYERTPSMPLGNQAHWADFMAAWPLLFTNHLMSLVFDGAFHRHPELRFVFVEGAFSWVLPTLWRMDAVWEERREDLPHVTCPPSEYVREHVRFTTQPLEEPDDAREYRRYMDWMCADQLLMFSTDYPHWSYDEPVWAAHQFPTTARDRIMWANATEFFGLPRTVAALPPLPAPK